MRLVGHKAEKWELGHRNPRRALYKPWFLVQGKSHDRILSRGGKQSDVFLKNMAAVLSTDCGWGCEVREINHENNYKNSSERWWLRPKIMSMELVKSGQLLDIFWRLSNRISWHTVQCKRNSGTGGHANEYGLKACQGELLSSEMEECQSRGEWSGIKFWMCWVWDVY